MNLDALERAADALAIRLLGEVTLATVASGALPPHRRVSSTQPVLRVREVMPSRPEAARRVGEGEALRLYADWRDRIGSDDFPPDHPWSPGDV